MSSRVAALLFAGSLIVASACAAEPAVSGGTITFAIARSGDSWAMIRSRPYALELHRNGRASKFQLTELGAVTDVAPAPSIEWSWDGRFVMVKYLSEENASTIEIYAADDSKSV